MHVNVSCGNSTLASAIRKRIEGRAKSNRLRIRQRTKVQPLQFYMSFKFDKLVAFDPVMGEADYCEKYNLWMHVDVSCGKSTLASVTRTVGIAKSNRLGKGQRCNH